MSKKINLEWLIAAGTRAIKTLAQTALGMFTVGMALNEVNWTYVVSVSVVAGIYSLLTSLATDLPEVGSDGMLQIDKNDPTKDTYRLVLNGAIENIGAKKVVRLTVDPSADLSQN
jgi:hypothetical protein